MKHCPTLSMGLPDPLKIRPSMSSDTGIVKTSPVNSTRVFLLSIPLVPSKTCSEKKPRMERIFQPKQRTQDLACRFRKNMQKKTFSSFTWTTALDPETSRTCPRLISPVPSLRVTISANMGACKMICQRLRSLHVRTVHSRGIVHISPWNA
jgi:hypothetical protein